jgi:hypothetical protein
MPSTLALAVVCGLVFERWCLSHSRLIASALIVSYLIFGALLVRGWVVMTFWSHLFQDSQIAGRAIDAETARRQATLYVARDSIDLNMLAYVRGEIRAVSLDDLARLKSSAVAVMLPEEKNALAGRNPELRLTNLASVARNKTEYLIVEIETSETR